MSERRAHPLPPPRDRAAGDLCLSFDDGPDPIWTVRVLDELERAGARATFFVQPREPELVERILLAGHEVAYHCGRHLRHGEREPAELAGELERDLGRLAELGARPRRWRPPWGEIGPATAALAQRHGLELWLWSDDPEDWSGATAAEMLARLEPAIGPGSVVLLHDGLGPGARRAGCAETVALIAPLVELGRSRGLGAETIESGDRRPRPVPVGGERR